MLEPGTPVGRRGRWSPGAGGAQSKAGTGRGPMDDGLAPSEPGGAAWRTFSIETGFRGPGPADFDHIGP